MTVRTKMEMRSDELAGETVKEGELMKRRSSNSVKMELLGQSSPALNGLYELYRTKIGAKQQRN